MDAKTQIRIWKFGGLSPWELTRQTWLSFRDGQLAPRCAQFSYFSMLSMVPLLIVIVAAIGFMPIEGVLGSFLTLLRRALPPDAYELISDQITMIKENGSTTTTYLVSSLFVFLYGGSRLFLTIGEGLNIAFGHAPRTRRFRSYWLSITMTFGIAILLMLVLILLVLGPMVVEQLFQSTVVVSYSFHFVRWVIVTAFLLIFTSAIYCFVPAHGLPFRWFTPGTVFAVAGWTLASQLFRLYVKHFALNNQVYGTLGGVVVMLLWLYLIAAIMFMGGQINGIIYQTIQQSDRQEA